MRYVTYSENEENIVEKGLIEIQKILMGTEDEAKARLLLCLDKYLDPSVVDTMADMAPQRVVYVSCDPATLARDVKRFGERGYTPRLAEAVDLFPRTAHVETVVLLSPKNMGG